MIQRCWRTERWAFTSPHSNCPFFGFADVYMFLMLPCSKLFIPWFLHHVYICLSRGIVMLVLLLSQIVFCCVSSLQNNWVDRRLLCFIIGPPIARPDSGFTYTYKICTPHFCTLKCYEDDASKGQKISHFFWYQNKNKDHTFYMNRMRGHIECVVVIFVNCLTKILLLLQASPKSEPDDVLSVLSGVPCY